MPTEQPTRKSAKDIVKEYLDRRAAEDQLFAASYAKPAKNIDDCWTYILGEARSKGSAVCMSDQEVFGLAVHYYDEDNIKVSPVAGQRLETVEIDLRKMKVAQSRAVCNGNSPRHNEILQIVNDNMHLIRRAKASAKSKKTTAV